MEKVCLVIGAGAGIGGTVAKKFAKEGYHAYLARRTDEEGLNKLINEISDAGGKASGSLLNVIEENSDIIIPALGGYIVNNNPKEWYTTNDTISLTGQTNVFAPGPINYSWWYSGIVNLGYGENLVLSAQDIGLGEHTLRLTVRDIFGNSAAKEVAMAKLYATESASRIIDRCVQIHGGLGVKKGSVPERLYREIRALRIYEGASEIQKVVIARQMQKDYEFVKSLEE